MIRKVNNSWTLPQFIYNIKVQVFKTCFVVRICNTHAVRECSQLFPHMEMFWFKTFENTNLDCKLKGLKHQKYSQDNQNVNGLITSICSRPAKVSFRSHDPFLWYLSIIYTNRQWRGLREKVVRRTQKRVHQPETRTATLPKSKTR